MKLGIVAMSIFVWVVSAVLVLDVIGATGSVCPSNANCICGGRPAVELKCNIDGKEVSINLLPNTYLNIKCGHASYINYDKIPNLSANDIGVLKSVTFKDCPLPKTSFKDVLINIGVSKTMSLIFQNSKNLSRYLDRKQFEGLQDLTKLLLSVSSTTHIPDNLFIDMQNLTWLNIRSNGNNLSRKLFEPLEKLETLEISHNGKTNITSNVFPHLTLLRKLSLWQSNVTRFSEDLFNGVEVLEELDLSSNGLNELPSSIFNPLRKLKKLTLFSNKFSTLPADLFRNNVDLDTVNIFNNDVKLKTLPRGLFKAKSNLNEVYIQRCALEDIPKDLFSNSPKISNISLAYNEIEKLPEAIFNDQINLLDLDLSHNKIKELEPKIFSSLVRLERLKLSHNSLQVISGSTFSSLLSLEYLNLSNNNLRTITSMLFSNNKQRMTIIMSYNQLDFENTVRDKNEANLKISPFGDISKMKLLDLSHNALKDVYVDWWLNGHESIDISYNNITRLQNVKLVERAKKKKARESYQKPLKQIRINHNPLICNCQNAIFLARLQEQKTKGASINQLNCSYLQLSFCEETDIAYFFLIPIFIVFSMLSVFAIISYRHNIYESIKFILYEVHGTQNDYDRSAKHLIINYANEDKDFVLQHLLPGLNTCNETQLSFMMKPISSFGKKKNVGKAIRNFLKTSDNDVSLVLLTPTYLMAVYQDINIKKIRHELSKNKRAIFIFADIGPENSLFTYLKEESDPRHSIIWDKTNFWDILPSMINARVYEVPKYTEYNKYRYLDSGIHGSYNRVRDNPRTSAFRTLAQGKV